jgi:hypothetical protein
VALAEWHIYVMQNLSDTEYQTVIKVGHMSLILHNLTVESVNIQNITIVTVLVLVFSRLEFNVAYNIGF